MIALLAIGCNNGKVKETHEVEVVKLYLSSYSSGFELFAEADPLVTGKTCNVLAHFTRLQDFKPPDCASVTLRLVSNGNETAVNGATDVRRVRSASSQGFSFVWVEFDWGTDVFKPRQIVSEKLITVTAQMPLGVGQIFLLHSRALWGKCFSWGSSQTVPV